MYILLFFLVALIIWIVYSINQPPKWVGQSDNGKWETNFTSEINSPKGYWSGKIYSRYDEDINIQKASLIKNGTVIHDWDGNETIKKNQPFEYLTTTKTLNNKKDRYVLNISWNDTNGTHEDTITLSPKQRYFVLPNFLN
jgi:hypothetical protein